MMPANSVGDIALKIMEIRKTLAIVMYICVVQLMKQGVAGAASTPALAVMKSNRTGTLNGDKLQAPPSDPLYNSGNCPGSVRLSGADTWWFLNGLYERIGYCNGKPTYRRYSTYDGEYYYIYYAEDISSGFFSYDDYWVVGSVNCPYSIHYMALRSDDSGYTPDQANPWEEYVSFYWSTNYGVDVKCGTSAVLPILLSYILPLYVLMHVSV